MKSHRRISLLRRYSTVIFLPFMIKFYPLNILIKSIFLQESMFTEVMKSVDGVIEIKKETSEQQFQRGRARMMKMDDTAPYRSKRH